MNHYAMYTSQYKFLNTGIYYRKCTKNPKKNWICRNFSRSVVNEWHFSSLNDRSGTVWNFQTQHTRCRRNKQRLEKRNSLKESSTWSIARRNRIVSTRTNGPKRLPGSRNVTRYCLPQCRRERSS